MAAPLTMPEVARLLAEDIPDGTYVNLGIGLPTLVQAHLPAGRDVVLHSENGILGMGAPPPPERLDRDLVNAGKQPTTLVAGASLFDSVTSFAMIRGGHLDRAVLGAYQVSVTGDIANWTLGGDDALPSVGGAMDLAAAGQPVHVIMPLLTKEGRCKIVAACTLPLTAVGCVRQVWTDHATFVLEDGQAWVAQSHGGLGLSELSDLTGLPLRRWEP